LLIQFSSLFAFPVLFSPKLSRQLPSMKNDGYWFDCEAAGLTHIAIVYAPVRLNAAVGIVTFVLDAEANVSPFDADKFHALDRVKLTNVPSFPFPVRSSNLVPPLWLDAR